MLAGSISYRYLVSEVSHAVENLMDLESVYSELDKERTIRLRPLEDHLIVRPIERKSSLRA